MAFLISSALTKYQVIKLKFMSVKISRWISFLGFLEILAQKLKICLGMQFCGTFSL
ncbi:MAG: hypothetical protein ACD_15C00016G0003 [uncultured bacterium]|nr:MAG: hypothetical protein ACD_15C00016G0003 [uncultured bacterium]